MLSNHFRPFSVTPEIGTLPVQESMQVTVEYTPQKTGDHHEDLVLSYDTGNVWWLMKLGNFMFHL